MNTARIIVLMVALGAGGVAAYLASGSDAAPAPAAPVAQLPTVDVLVAKSDIGLGQKQVRADGSGFMAAVLPAGMRAISTEISRRRQKSPERNAPDIVSSEIIMANVRVLAIDDDTEVTEGRSI